MFEWLNRIVGRKDRLTRLAQRSDRRAFIETMGQCRPYVLAAMQSEGLDAETFSAEDLIEEVARCARDLSERETFACFQYELDGSDRLPFFSSEKNAQTFCGEYSKMLNRVFPFQLLEVHPSAIADLIDCCDELVFNDQSSDEQTLTHKDTRLLKEIWGTDHE